MEYFVSVFKIHFFHLVSKIDIRSILPIIEVGLKRLESLGYLMLKYA